MVRQVEAALCDCYLVQRSLAAGAVEPLVLSLNRFLTATIVYIGEFQKDEAEDRRA